MGFLNRGPQVRTSLVVDRHPHGHVRRVVPNATLRNRLAERFFEQHGIRNDLQPIRRPRRRLIRRVPPRPTAGPPALVLIRHERPVPPLHAIDLSQQSQCLRREVERHRLALIIGFERSMKLPPRKDPLVRHGDTFDFLKVIQPPAVRQGVKRLHPQRRGVRVENGQGGHGLPYLCFPRAFAGGGTTGGATGIWNQGSSIGEACGSSSTVKRFVTVLDAIA